MIYECPKCRQEMKLVYRYWGWECPVCGDAYVEETEELGMPKIKKSEYLKAILKKLRRKEEK